MGGYLRLLNSKMGEKNPEVGPGTYDYAKAFPDYRGEGVEELKTGQNYDAVESCSNEVSVRLGGKNTKPRTRPQSLKPRKYKRSNLDITPQSTKINPKYFLRSKMFPGSPAFNSKSIRIVPHPLASLKKKPAKKKSREKKFKTLNTQSMDHFDKEIEH